MSLPAGGYSEGAASAADVDEGILQAGFVDTELEPERPRGNPGGGSRSRATDRRNTKRAESASETLTWQAAVKRLNEVQIRSLRLEPSKQ